MSGRQDTGSVETGLVPQRNLASERAESAGGPEAGGGASERGSGAWAAVLSGRSGNGEPNLTNRLPGSDREVRGGCDWLGVSVWATFDEAGFAELRKVLDGAIRKSEEEEGNRESLVEIGGRDFEVFRCGLRVAGLRYCYRLVCEGLALVLAPFAVPGKRPNLMVTADGTACLSRGGQVGRVWADCCDVLEALGGRIEKNTVSRFDAAVDLVGVDVIELVRLYREGAFVSRARKFTDWEKGGKLTEAEKCSILEAVRRRLDAGDDFATVYGQGLRSTGLTIGSDDLLCRIYDKIAECREGDKLALMVARRWGGEMPEVASRVEFQVRSERLRESGVRTVDDLLVRQNVLVAYLCENWLVVRQPGLARDRDRKRSEVHELWERVQSGFRASFWAGDDDEELRPVERVPSGRQLSMFRGVASSIVAAVGASVEDAADRVELVMGELRRIIVGEDGGESFLSRCDAKREERDRRLPPDVRPPRFLGQLIFPEVSGELAYGVF